MWGKGANRQNPADGKLSKMKIKFHNANLQHINVTIKINVNFGCRTL